MPLLTRTAAVAIGSMALYSAASALLITPADARPRHHRHAHHHHHVRHHHAVETAAPRQPAMAVNSAVTFNNDGKPVYAGPPMMAPMTTPMTTPMTATASMAEPRAAMASARQRRAHAAPAGAAPAGFGSSGLVATARSYLGTNPTGRRSLWCGAFMDMVLRRSGHAGGGNLAKAYARYGTRVAGPQVGAIAVMSRKGGGHVGVVSGVDANGNPIIISGNHNRTVAETVYPRSRVTAYVVPN